jgi:Flp pilus assembly pilin Flp
MTSTPHPTTAPPVAPGPHGHHLRGPSPADAEPDDPRSCRAHPAGPAGADGHRACEPCPAAPTVAGVAEADGPRSAAPCHPSRQRMRRVRRRAWRRDERGQATAEYGLVILVAGLIALGVIAWARGTGSFTDMFEGIINTLTSGV